MAEEAAKLPAGIERVRLVTLPASGKVVEVHRWSLQRSLEVSGLIQGSLSKVDSKNGVDGMEFLNLILGADLSNLIQVLRLSMRPEDASVVSLDMDPADTDALMDAMIALNGGLAKNVLAFPEKFVAILGTKKGTDSQ